MADWHPSLSTQPLSEDFVTDGDKLLQVVDLAWSSPEQSNFELEEWQRWLIRHVLERYPDDHHKYPGELRYKQVVISMGRQNGKSVLGAILGIYGLLQHVQGPEVISVASSVPQAEIIYKRVKFVIDSKQSLRKRFKTTGTRGITSRQRTKPGTYVVKTGQESSLQGVTMSVCLYDEIHLTKPETWSAVVFGISARKDGMIIGITTAGDDKSILLKDLYKRGRKAALEGEDERFGFFLWEAPETTDIQDDESLKAGLIAANPSIASGRIDIAQKINDVRNMPENQARRYALNQFVAAESSWLPMSNWNRLERHTGIDTNTRDIVWGVDRTENWTYASVTASIKKDGKMYTEVVASLQNPTVDVLEGICVELSNRHGGLFMMESANLKDLAMRLRERGVKTEYLSQSQMINACATAYSLIAEQRIVHSGSQLVGMQVPRGVAKNIGDGWRISRRDSAGDVDALLATVMSLYGASIQTESAPLLYVG